MLSCFGLPLVALFMLSNVDSPTRREPDGAAVVQEAAPAALPSLQVGSCEGLEDALRMRALAPLPEQLGSAIARQFDAAAHSIISVTEILKLREALALAPGVDINQRGVQVSLGVAGELD